MAYTTNPGGLRYRDDILGVLKPASAGKCVYCERKLRRIHLDHFRPKSGHPALVYTWENWALSCGDCNENKGAEFPLIDGCAALINPLDEDPVRFLRWDVGERASSGFVEPRLTDPVVQCRVNCTSRVLGLNDEMLAEARRAVWDDLAFLLACVTEGVAGAVDRLRSALCVTAEYRSVIRQAWHTTTLRPLFVRVAGLHPEFAPLFARLDAPLHHPDHPPPAAGSPSIERADSAAAAEAAP